MSKNKVGWLIYRKKDAKENQTYIKWFIEEAAAQNICLKLIYHEELMTGILNGKETILFQQKSIELPNFVVVRAIDPFLSLHFEQSGVKVFNSSEVSELCNHKSYTHLELNKLNIPMVHSLFIQKNHLLASPPMQLPFVIKEATGRSGQQVHFIQTIEEWKECSNHISSNELLIQAANVQLGKDLRVFVVGKEIIGAVLRESTTDFRANFKLGGTATLYKLNQEEESMIQRIIDHIDFGMVGIDFLIGYEGQLLFNEIEDVVGSRILSAVSDINILEKYVEYIKKHI